MGQLSKWLFILFLVIYGVVSFVYSSKQGYWHDEIHTLTFLKGVSAYPFAQGVLDSDTLKYVHDYQKLMTEDKFWSNFSLQVLHEGHPPVYYLLLKPWSFLLGTSEPSLRGFSILSGLVSFFVLFLILRRSKYGNLVIWPLTIIILLNPFLFYFFNEARMYSLAFLFAACSYYYWDNIVSQRVSKNKMDTILFVVFSTLLLYTHYYGIFFISILVAMVAIRRGFSTKTLVLSLPFLFFLPWGLVIVKQLQFHNTHWTDGSIGLVDSLIGFATGISKLLISPLSELSKLETAFVIIMMLSLIWQSRKNGKPILFFGLMVGVYFLQVFLFDITLDHHSVLVPRYYAFVLILLFMFIGDVLKKSRLLFVLGFTGIYASMSVLVLVQVFNLERAPKQMFREAANYIDANSNSNSVIVVEPKGPLNFGLAYYLNGNYEIIPADEYVSDSLHNVFFVDENLGVAIYENKLNNEKQSQLKQIQFVGLNIYH